MSADEALAGWSGTPREVAMKTMQKYGQPTGMTPNMISLTRCPQHRSSAAYNF
jgi:hypothetical protein